ncbi:MAG TPA: hypothetical protein VJ715_15920 [Pyrinomonadaceae bacterium]|nr:hypothetical protein [Pyrinomonadaceae bacterium]
MRTYAYTIRYAVAGLVLLGALAVFGAQQNVSAQEAGKESAPAKVRRTNDPFAKYVPPVRKTKKVASASAPVAPPSIQERIEGYKAQKLAAMNRQLPAPKPTTALLLSEMQVTGIFRTPRGYAAMIEATPIKLSYTIYPGETFFDGQLVAIEEDRLVFRRETRWSDGRVQKVVENKPLRQPNAVTDSLTVSRAAAEGGSGAATAAAATAAPAETPSTGGDKAPTPEQK